MMKKIDQEKPKNPLLSQNISIIEVGVHSKIFEKFIDFIGLTKSIIITDIDSYYKIPDKEKDGTPKINQDGTPKYKVKRCSACDKEAKFTSNNSLQFFHKNGTSLLLDYFKKLPFEWKILRKNRKKEWVSNRKGKLLMIYQIVDCGYHARSFEDAFFHINRDFIINPDNSFDSITPKHLKAYTDDKIDCFTFSELGVGSKPSLAIEILLNSTMDDKGNEFANWSIPEYIKEGLLWLKED